tara:strand:- start:936 stop:1115 length:180 start_codon:yes stop_codon:yes gene_type:complete
MAVKERLTKIVESLQAAAEDADRFDRGNASAGTRVRKAAQEAKKELQELRIMIQERKNA